MGNGGICLATGFAEVDKNPDIERAASCLRFIEGEPSFSAYKKRSFELMRVSPGDIAFDVGCGLGFDAHRLSGLVSPGGAAVGIDASASLLGSAREKFGRDGDAAFVRADMRKLPIRGESVDAIRCDRVLQHVERPREAIVEMVRALKPGGRLVCAEPDWSTFVIDAHDPAVTRRVAERWRDCFRNPDVGRRLLGWIREEGLHGASLEGCILLADGLSAVDIVYDVRKTVAMLEDEEKDARGRYASWLEALAGRDGMTPVTASVTLFLAAGRKT